MSSSLYRWTTIIVVAALLAVPHTASSNDQGPNDDDGAAPASVTFTSVQEAIDHAMPHAVVVLHASSNNDHPSPWTESIKIPADKQGLTLCGAGPTTAQDPGPVRVHPENTDPGDVCDPAHREQVVVDASGRDRNVLEIHATNVTVTGITLRWSVEAWDLWLDPVGHLPLEEQTFEIVRVNATGLTFQQNHVLVKAGPCLTESCASPLPGRGIVFTGNASRANVTNTVVTTGTLDPTQGWIGGDIGILGILNDTRMEGNRFQGWNDATLRVELDPSGQNTTVRDNHFDATGPVSIETGTGNLTATGNDLRGVPAPALILGQATHGIQLDAAGTDWGAYECGTIHGNDILPGRIQDAGTGNSVDINPFIVPGAMLEDSCPIVRLTIDDASQGLRHRADNEVGFTFTATAFDEHGGRVPVNNSKDIQWTIEPGGGNFEQNTLVPGNQTGNYTVTARSVEDPEIRSETSFQILSGALSKLVWTETVDVTDADTSVTFEAEAQDEHGNPTDDTVTYAFVEGSGSPGTVDGATGEYTPQWVGTAQIEAHAQGVTSEPHAIIVVAGALESIGWAETVDVTDADIPVNLSAMAHDQHGNPTEDPLEYRLQDGPGTIDAATGVYTPDLVGAALIEARSQNVTSEPHAITVVPGATDAVEWIHAGNSTNADTPIDLLAEARDQHGNPTEDPLEYRLQDGPGTIDAATGVYTPDLVGAALIEAQTHDVTSKHHELTVVAGATVFVEWIDAELSTDADTPIDLLAEAQDQHGNPTNDTVDYAVKNGTGSIDPEGKFIPDKVGSATVEACVDRPEGEEPACSDTQIQVLSGKATDIIWDQNPEMTLADTNVTFLARPQDQHDNPTNGTVDYTVKNGTGSIDPKGKFIPDKVGSVTIEACVERPDGQAPACIDTQIQVKEGALAGIRIVALDGPIEAGDAIRWTALGLDEKGNEFEIAPAWSLIHDECGTIDEHTGDHQSPLNVTQCTVAAQQNGFTDTSLVQIVDTTPPEFMDPFQDLVVQAENESGRAVTYEAPAVRDQVDGPGVADCSPALGSFFSVGETLVTCTAEDQAGNTATGEFQITVTPPDAPPAPVALEFDLLPTHVTSGSPFTVTAHVLDEEGRRVTDAASRVTLFLEQGPAGASLGGTVHQQAEDGVAMFHDLTLDRVGNNTLLATASGLEEATTDVIQVVPGAATNMHFDVVPETVTANQGFHVELELRDENGNLAVDATHDVALSVFNGPGSFNKSASSQQGRVVLDEIALSTPAIYNLRASSPGVEPATSRTIDVRAPPPATLNITTQPSSIQSGDSLGFTVEIVDDDDDRVLDAMNTVTLSIATGPADGDLRGQRTVTAADGEAVFEGLQLDRVGAYTLLARATGLGSDTSKRIDVGPGAPAGIGFAVLPTRLTADQAFSALLEVRDGAGNLVTGLEDHNVALEMHSGQGTLENGGIRGVAEHGTVLFEELVLPENGDHELRAELTDGSGGVVLQQTSPSIKVAPGAPAKLAFDLELFPQEVTSGQEFSVDVHVLDMNDNLVTDASGPVKISRAVGPAGDPLQGNLEGVPEDGVVTFTGLRLGRSGLHSLLATQAGLVATSPNIQVEPGEPDRVVFTSLTQPTSPFSATVRVEDAQGNRVPDATATVEVSIARGPTDTGLQGTLTRDVANGMAVFDDLELPSPGTYRLTAESPGLESGVSGEVRLNPPSAENVTGLRLEPTGPLEIEAGETISFTVVALTNGEEVEDNFSVEYRLSNPSIATVSSEGTLRGLETGAVSLEARLGDVASDPVTIRVAPGELERLRVSPGSTVVPVDDTAQFIAEGRDAFGNTVPLTHVSWSIDGTLHEQAMDPREPFFFPGSANEGIHRVEATSGKVQGVGMVNVTGLHVAGDEQADLDAAITGRLSQNLSVTKHSAGVASAETGARLTLMAPTEGQSLLGEVEADIGRDAHRLSLAVESQPGNLDTSPEGLDMAELIDHMASLATADTPAHYLQVSATEGGQELSSSRLNEVLGSMNSTFRLPVSYFEDNGLDPDRVRLIEFSDGERVDAAIVAARVSPESEGGFFEYRVKLESFSAFAVVATQETKQDSKTGGGGGGGGGEGGGDDPPRVHRLPLADDPVFKEATLTLDGPHDLPTLSVESKPVDDPPENIPDLPAGLDLHRWLHVETGDNKIKGDLTLEFSLEASKVSEPERGHILRLVDGAWLPEAQFHLTLEEGRYVGSASTPCCSVFAIVFDLEPPEVTLDLPRGPQAAPFVLQVTAQDNLGIDQVEFRIGEKEVAVVDEAPYEYALDPAQYDQGNHTVTATATDLSGWTTSDTQSVWLRDGPKAGVNDGQTPGLPASGVWTTILVLAAVLLVAALSIVFYWRQRNPQQ